MRKWAACNCRIFKELLDVLRAPAAVGQRALAKDVGMARLVHRLRRQKKFHFEKVLFLASQKSVAEKIISDIFKKYR